MTTHTLVSQQGHMFLPLSVKTQLSGFTGPEHYFITVYVGGGAFDDATANTREEARIKADNLMTQWSARLMPAFEAGRAVNERDLAHEADMRELYRKQLRADIGDDVEAYMGDPRRIQHGRVMKEELLYAFITIASCIAFGVMLAWRG